MAPNGAFGLAALSGALILFLGSGWRRRAAGLLALLMLFEAVLALLGYLHGTRSLYQVARALRLSQYTALDVLVRRTAGGLLARRVLPPILTLPILLGFLLLVALLIFINARVMDRLDGWRRRPGQPWRPATQRRCGAGRG